MSKTILHRNHIYRCLRTADFDGMVASWEKGIQKAAQAQQQNWIVRRLMKMYSASDVFQVTLNTVDSFITWAAAFARFLDRLNKFEQAYHREHGSGLYRIRGFGKADLKAEEIDRRIRGSDTVDFCLFRCSTPSSSSIRWPKTACAKMSWQTYKPLPSGQSVNN